MHARQHDLQGWRFDGNECILFIHAEPFIRLVSIFAFLLSFAQGFIKGYISHEKMYLVLSAKDAFPSFADVYATNV